MSDEPKPPWTETPPDWVEEVARDLDRGFALTGTRIPSMLVGEVRRLRAIQASIASDLGGVVERVRARKGTDQAMMVSLGDWLAIKRALAMAKRDGGQP